MAHPFVPLTVQGAAMDEGWQKAKEVTPGTKEASMNRAQLRCCPLACLHTLKEPQPTCFAAPSLVQHHATRGPETAATPAAGTTTYGTYGATGLGSAGNTTARDTGL